MEHFLRVKKDIISNHTETAWMNLDSLEEWLFMIIEIKSLVGYWDGLNKLFSLKISIDATRHWNKESKMK